jgi:hypothetical protein
VVAKPPPDFSSIPEEVAIQYVFDVGALHARAPPRELLLVSTRCVSFTDTGVWAQSRVRVKVDPEVRGPPRWRGGVGAFLTPARPSPLAVGVCVSLTT